ALPPGAVAAAGGTARHAGGTGGRVARPGAVLPGRCRGHHRRDAAARARCGQLLPAAGAWTGHPRADRHPPSGRRSTGHDQRAHHQRPAEHCRGGTVKEPTSTPPPAPARPNASRGRWPLRDYPAVVWLLAAVVVAIAHQVVPSARWLMVHLVLLGAITHSIMVWSTYFAQRSEERRVGKEGSVRQSPARHS